MIGVPAWAGAAVLSLGGALAMLASMPAPTGAGEWPAIAERPARIHQIQRGDTLTALARRYGVTIRALTQANRLPGPTAVLRVGARLTIPPVPGAAARGAPRPEAARFATPGGPRQADGAPLPPGPTFIWPLEGPVSSHFGRRRSGWHDGIDILAPRGTPIRAAADGVVVASGRERLYGRVVKIDHGGGFLTVYAHNDENLVDVGAWVTAGQVVATVGRTGRATREHLHFEIRQARRAFDPIAFLDTPVPIVVAHEAPPDDGQADD